MKSKQSTAMAKVDNVSALRNIVACGAQINMLGESLLRTLEKGEDNIEARKGLKRLLKIVTEEGSKL